MKKVYGCLALISVLSGCATSTATTTELPVKVVPEKMVEKCVFVQQFAINKTNLFNSVNAKIDQAQQDAAQRVIQGGGDTMVIDDTDITANGHVVNVTVSAYKCG